jgi:hypothetical protein
LVTKRESLRANLPLSRKRTEKSERYSPEDAWVTVRTRLLPD